uniref:Tonsoku-like protein n=1 Tax=Nothobranchius furzeri TaxID=105023 RepID=A0A8C6LFG3_NOTFU
SNHLKEEANICNQLGELLSRTGDYKAAIREHQQELALSEALKDVIGRAVAHRKIGECYAEMGNIEAALKHQHHHLDLARSVRDHAEEQRALATIGRTYLFCYESDQSKNSLKLAEDAFRKSLAIVDERLGGMVSEREISEMKARLFLNLGLVCDHLGEPKRCSEFIRRSVFIAESQLLEDLYRANFNLGNIYFRNGQHSNSVRCLEQAKECSRKMKDKFAESECFHCIGKVGLSLGDFVAARRSLKKALLLGSQQPADKQAVKKAFKYADRGCRLEEELGEDQEKSFCSHRAVELSEQLGDLYCKVGCYSKALEAYQAQLKGAEMMAKPARELAVIHVSLAATCTDLRQHDKAVEHYRKELALRQGSSTEKQHFYHSFTTGLCKSSSYVPQKRTLRLWLAFQRRSGSSEADDTAAKLQELCASKGCDPEESDGEEDEEEETDNTETLEDSDVVLSDSGRQIHLPCCRSFLKHRNGFWNKRNEKGETSLHRACIDGNLKQVQCLVEQGHPVNPRDYCGWTPLHEACNHGHYDVVALLLERGANINDPGGPLCEGVTPLHDALACGNLKVARLLVERGASVTLRNSKGETPSDTLRHWQKMYSRELDKETRQECLITEKLLRKALSRGGEGLSTYALFFLQSFILKMTFSHLLPISVPSAPAAAKPFDALQDSQLFDAENSEPLATTRGDSDIKSAFQVASSSSDDSDGSVSPLRPVHPRRTFLAAQSQKEIPPEELAAVPSSSRDGTREAPAPSVFGRDEYHSAIRGLGSSKTLQQSFAHPQFSSTPAASSISKSALVPEDEYLADDWLEDDLLEMQPKKKRRLRMERGEPRGEETASSSAARTQASAAPTPTSLPPPIRMRVRVQEDVFLIPVPQSEAESCTVSWLCDQAARRYYQKCGLLPRLSLQKEGALLSPQDLLLAVLQTNEEVLAEVCSWDLPPLPERYRKACESLAVEENKRVTRLCEVQDSSSSVSVCGLSLGPASLNPLLRAFKLQASLSELRVSGNRLSDDLLPELVAATTTMPHLRLLDVSANLITGDGLERAVGALKGQSHPAFPCLEELNLSMNPLGDAVSESLSCLLSLCPLLSKLSLQACGLTARFLQQHRLLLASALKELGHLKSVSLSHNALGSTGFELVLRTLPLHSLTHLDLSAIRRGPTDHPALEHLTKEECSLTHLSLASNGLTDSSIIVLSRCLPLCPTLVSLNLSGNPSVTSVGLQSILMSMREASRPLTHLNLQGCQVSGPWDSYALDGLSTHVQELRLCSRSLNKLNRDALKQNWVKNHPDGCFLNQNSKFLLSAADSSR